MPPPALAGYWHDAGHARLKEAMGLLDHRQQLEANASRHLGFHLHDVDSGGHDHQAIGSGEVDFEMLRPFGAPSTFSLSSSAQSTTVEGVLSSKARVRALMARMNAKG